MSKNKSISTSIYESLKESVQVLNASEKIKENEVVDDSQIVEEDKSQEILNKIHDKINAAERLLKSSPKKALQLAQSAQKLYNDNSKELEGKETTLSGNIGGFIENIKKHYLKEYEATVFVNDTAPEPDYKITDVTVLEPVADGDVLPPDMQSLLVMADQELTESVGADWGHINILSSRAAKDGSKSNALFELRTPTKTRLMSFVLEGADALKEFSVYSSMGQKKFVKKTTTPVKVMEQFISQFIEADKLEEAEKENGLKENKPDKKAIKKIIEDFLAHSMTNSLLPSMYEMIQEEIALYNKNKDVADTGDDLGPTMYKKLRERINGFVSQLPTCSMNGNHDSYTMKDGILVYGEETEGINLKDFDSIIETLFGAEWTDKEVKTDKDIEKAKENVLKEEANPDADKLIKDYYAHKMDLPTLHDKLEKLFGNKKDAFEYLASNDLRVKNLKETTNRELEKRKEDLRTRERQALKDAGVEDYENLARDLSKLLPKDVYEAFDLEREELSCIDMLHSILTYSSNHDVNKVLENKYLQDYIDRLGYDKVKELANQEIEEYKNATINHDVYTDGEGVSYNSVTFKDDVDESLKESDMYIDEYYPSLDDAKKVEKKFKSEGRKTEIKKNGNEYELWVSYEKTNESENCLKESRDVVDENFVKFIYDTTKSDFDKYGESAWSGREKQKTANGKAIYKVDRNGKSDYSSEDIIKAVEEKFPQLKKLNSDDRNIEFIRESEDINEAEKLEYKVFKRTALDGKDWWIVASTNALEREKETGKLQQEGKYKTKKEAIARKIQLEKQQKSVNESVVPSPYRNIQIGDIAATYNVNTGEIVYSIPSKNINDKKKNINDIEQTDVPYDTETIIRNYIEKNVAQAPQPDVKDEDKSDGSEKVEVKDTEKVEEADEEPNVDNPAPNGNGDEEAITDETQSETGSAFFFLKPKSVDFINDALRKGVSQGKSTYVVVKEVNLPDDEFNNYCNDLQGHYDFLEDINIKDTDTKNFSFNVVKVTNNNSNFSVLADPVGYDYTRYGAIIK